MSVLTKDRLSELFNKQAADPGLEAKLSNGEGNRSLLENALRRDALRPIAGLSENGEVTQVSFRDTGMDLAPQEGPEIQAALPKLLTLHQNKVLEAVKTEKKVTQKRVAVLFSGGPAAGGHNVILGIKDMLGRDNTLFGVEAGPKGLLAGALCEITEEDIVKKRNLGGFDFLGSDRTKIKTEEQFNNVKETVRKFRLDAIIIIGGDDSNTNAAMLAEFLIPEKCAVLGVPKTIDGDLQVGQLLPISFGFDTATKIYAEMVGNILQDTPSSRKYWHFVRLMGRSASQVTLEVALQTKPAVVLVSEEVAARRQSLESIVESIAETVAKRAGNGIHHGVVLIPEGIIEFIPEISDLIAELNEQMAEVGEDWEKATPAEKVGVMAERLSEGTRALFLSLPTHFSEKLLMDRDSHGNLQVSLIESEKLLADMVGSKLHDMQHQSADYFGKRKKVLNSEEIGRFLTYKPSFQTHFFGYEGRCGAPSRFDAEFTYNLGLVSGALALDQKTGYMAALTDFDKGGRALAIPLSGLIAIERRHGKDALVIEKALVDMDAPAFQYYEKRKSVWAESDVFSSPGPRQYWGDCARQLPMLVALNQGYPELTYQLSEDGL